DFDRDGLPDLARIWTQSAPGETAIYYVSVAKGQGNGTFIEYFNWQFRTRISGVIAEDFNRDGRPDLLLYDYATGYLRVMAGTGSLVMGGFIDDVPLPGTGGMFLADMDGNGTKDVVYSNYRTFTVLRSVHGNPPLLSKLSLSPAAVTAGNSSTATVSVGDPAPADTQVTLASNNALVTFPGGSTVTIPAGATSATFQVATAATNTPASVNLTASSAGITQTAVLSVVPAYSITGLTASPSSLYGIFASTGTVTISGPADANAVIALSTNNPALVNVPASVTVPAGATAVTFPIKLQPVTADTPVSVSASLGGLTQTAGLTILKPADAVAVTKALYTQKSVQLNIEATSTSAVATLTAYNTATGAFIGTLQNSGGGKYKGNFLFILSGGQVTLKSSLGGTVTAAYQTK
ncbi:MAG: hypothetical protein RL328_272, partial [Acidobacteriota bacterium]